MPNVLYKYVQCFESICPMYLICIPNVLYKYCQMSWISISNVLNKYCKCENFCKGFIFAKLCIRKVLWNKTLAKWKKSLCSFSNVAIWLLMLFVKRNFSQTFPILQYSPFISLQTSNTRRNNLPSSSSFTLQRISRLWILSFKGSSSYCKPFYTPCIKIWQF